jgi:hypothetical protein
MSRYDDEQGKENFKESEQLAKRLKNFDKSEDPLPLLLLEFHL